MARKSSLLAIVVSVYQSYDQYNTRTCERARIDMHLKIYIMCMHACVCVCAASNLVFTDVILLQKEGYSTGHRKEP